MGAHRRLKFESFKKKEASDVHERLKFKFSKYGHNAYRISKKSAS